MSKFLDIHELRKEKERKQEKRIAIFNEILKLCHSKIIRASKDEKDKCIYQVPEMKIGLPVYNLNSCIAYLILNLNKNGFKVRFIKPNNDEPFMLFYRSKSQMSPEAIYLHVPKLNAPKNGYIVTPGTEDGYSGPITLTDDLTQDRKFDEIIDLLQLRLENPTLENIGLYIYKRLKKMDLHLHKILIKRKSCGETFILKV